MMRTRKRNPRPREQAQTAEQIEALQIQINQIQEQINYLSLLSSQLSPRSRSDLRALSAILYFLFLPFRLILRLWRLLTDPNSYWTGFYWMCFVWILILDGGLHPRRLAKSIGLLKQ